MCLQTFVLFCVYVCVTGKHKHQLVPKYDKSNGNVKECDNHEQQQLQSQYIINSNNRTVTASMISNGTANHNGISNNISDLNNSNGISNGNNHLVLNNRDYNNSSIVTNNNKIYHNHHINNNNNNNTLCNNNNNQKSVILNYDKNTLDYKNNKNLILNQHQMYEKHLNGINQLKNELQSTKRFIISTTTAIPQLPPPLPVSAVPTTMNISATNNGSQPPLLLPLISPATIVDSCVDKFHINLAKNHRNNIVNRRNITPLTPSVDETDNAANDLAMTKSGILENMPTNVNIHKVNGHLNGILNSNSNIIKPSLKVTELSNGNFRNGHHQNGFVKNCSANGQNGRSMNDFSTIKINYVSRQAIRGCSVSTTTTTTTNPTNTLSNIINGHATNGNSHNHSNNNNNNNNFHHHGTVSLQENSSSSSSSNFSSSSSSSSSCSTSSITSNTSISSISSSSNIPNIVINGSNDCGGDKITCNDDDDDNNNNSKRNSHIRTGKKMSHLKLASYLL